MTMPKAQSALHGAALELARANMDLLQTLGVMPESAPVVVVDEPAPISEPAPMPEPVTKPPQNPAPALAPAPLALEPANAQIDTKHAVYDDVMALAETRENVLLAGPMGCGKSLIAAQIATELGLPYGSQACSAGMSESQLIGWLLPVGDSGRFEYVPSLFVTLYENGGVFLLDEVDAADENTMLILNGALAGDSWHLPQRFHNPAVRRHPDFICIGAANSLQGGDDVYTGRTRLDGATLDRFRAGIVEMDYDPALEALVVDADVLAWGHKLRVWMRNQGMRRSLSTRVLVRFSRQAKRGAGKVAWERAYFADWTQSERERWHAAS